MNKKLKTGLKVGLLISVVVTIFPLVCTLVTGNDIHYFLEGVSIVLIAGTALGSAVFLGAGLLMWLGGN